MSSEQVLVHEALGKWVGRVVMLDHSTYSAGLGSGPDPHGVNWVPDWGHGGTILGVSLVFASPTRSPIQWRYGDSFPRDGEQEVEQLAVEVTGQLVMRLETEAIVEFRAFTQDVSYGISPTVTKSVATDFLEIESQRPGGMRHSLTISSPPPWEAIAGPD